MRLVLKHGFLIVWLCLMSLPARAIDTGQEGWRVDGRLRQGFSAAIDLPDMPGQNWKDGPQNYLAEIKSSYSPSNELTFIGNFWMRGDWSTNRNGIFSTAGLVNPASPGFSGTLPMALQTDNCNPEAGAFCARASQLKRLDEAEDIIRELSVKYSDPASRYTVKFGKFQRGWGQSDGLRVLDLLHAQDLRERFAFKDSDELRIPALMLGMDFNLREMGVAGPFEAIGLNKPTLEFNIVPEVYHSKFIINNPTPSNATSGGLFGLPFPKLKDPISGLGLVGIGANLHDFNNGKSPHKLTLNEAELSTRLKFETLGGEGTINMFYGWQDLPVVKMRGTDVIVGSGFNNPKAPGAITVPVNLPTSIAAIWAPVGALGPTTGGYLPFLRGLTGAGPFSNSPLAALTNGGCFDPTRPVAGAVPCSVNINFDLDYDYRQKVVGFSFGRDLGDFMSFGPKGTAPTVRLEFAYEFDKPFNRSVVANPFTGAPERGSPVLVVDPVNSITKSDVITTMVGFDYPLWVPGWETQQKSIFTSFQFFNIHTKKADEGLLAQAPYAFNEVVKDQQYVTFLWNAPIMGERLILEGLLIKDLDKRGLFYRQRADFQYWGNTWRPRIEWMHFVGQAESAPYGIFDHSDFVEFSVTYQF